MPRSARVAGPVLVIGLGTAWIVPVAASLDGGGRHPGSGRTPMARFSGVAEPVSDSPTPTPTTTPSSTPTRSESPTPTPTTSSPTKTPPSSPPPSHPHSPDPTGPASPPHGRPAHPALAVSVQVSSTSVAAGGVLVATVRVTASGATAENTVVRISAPGVSVSPSTTSLGAVRGPRSAITQIVVPSNASSGTITVTARASASYASSASGSASFTVTGSSSSVPPGSTGNQPTLPSGTLPTGTLPTNTPPSDSVALPQVAAPPVAPPQIAPGSLAQPGPALVLRSSATEDHGDLTSAQAAWLAALACSCGLSLLKLRLTRRDGRSGRRVGRVQVTVPAKPVTVTPRPAPAGS
ncbi:hypothetical protein [Actinomadura gamaensis]|uniref:Uncharacterized protein n=1 Tax=Actinomadura gamaensis TaxID=1763541 RepID=A0ABV9U325_9ACTN